MMVDPLTAIVGSRVMSIAAAAGAYADIIKKAIFHGHPLDADTARGLLLDIVIHANIALAWLQQQTRAQTTTCTGAGSGWCDCPPDTETEDKEEDHTMRQIIAAIIAWLKTHYSVKDW